MLYEKAKQLIGKKVQKVESTRRCIVASVRDGSHFGKELTQIIFECGYKGLYAKRDIDSMIIDGKHCHQM